MIKNLRLFFLTGLFSIFLMSCNPFYGYSEAPAINNEQEDCTSPTDLPVEELTDDAADQAAELPSAEAEATDASSDVTDSSGDGDANASTDANASESEALELLPEPAPEPAAPLLRFTLSSAIKEAEISVEKAGSVYTLSSVHEFEKYYWKCGDRLLSQERECLIDTADFSPDIYPVVLLAEESDLLYSASYYINLNASRTILPQYSRSALKGLCLKIINAENSLLIAEEAYESCADFEKTELTLAEGNYYFNFSGTFEGFKLFDSVYMECKNDSKNLIEFFPKIACRKNDLENSSDSGKIDIVNYFMTDLSVSDACVHLYKEENGSFSLCDIRSFGDGSLLFYRGKDSYEDKKYIRYTANLEEGSYWFRCDCTASQGKLASYCMEMVYVSPGASSNYIIETSDFYNLYSINYHYNGGFYVGSKLVEKAASFDSFPLPDAQEMIKPGFSFSGWYYDADFSIFAGDSFFTGQLEADINLYAKWEALAEGNEASDTLNSWCNHIYIEESEDYIKLGLNSVEAGDVFVIKVYNKSGKLYEARYEDLKTLNNNSSVLVDFKCRPGESFLISVSAYSPAKLINNREAYQTRFCENYVFIPGFLH